MVKIWQDDPSETQVERIRRHKARIAHEMAAFLEFLGEEDIDGFCPDVAAEYPFAESFDETVMKVLAWRDAR